MKRLVRFALAALLCAAFPAAAQQGKALLLTKSGGFQHGPVTEKDGQPSLAETVLREQLAKHNLTLEETKNASAINAANLANYKLVLFYTQGDLDKPWTDNGEPMGPDGMKDLAAWISNGGAFIGFHSAADTSRPVKAEDPATPYTAIVGGAFKSHGKQFSGTVRVVDPKHAAIKSVPDGFTIADEWYVFTHLDTANMHVLAMLDPGEERAKQEQYNIPAYPITWCKEQGTGRIFYTAMGHREDVWSNETFLAMLNDAVDWATGKGKADAKPNYDKMIEKYAK